MQANPDFKVVIRGDKSLMFQFLAPVLMDCNLAHVKSFAFNTKQPTMKIQARKRFITIPART